MNAFGFRKASDLPALVSLFPLTGAILFPRSALPLNIFEPRYLNMIDDAMGSDRLIGMVQPAIKGADKSIDGLSRVGTVGKITTFAETDDGRYLITITGISRFAIEQELPLEGPYRRAHVDYGPFEDDLRAPLAISVERDRLRRTLSAYARRYRFEIDWSAVDGASDEDVVNAAAIMCPFDAAAKQALLEANRIEERCELLMALLEFGQDTPGADGRLQ